MTHTIRRFMTIEAASFAIAALIHAGYLIGGYEHREARNAESVIAAVLLAALAGTWARPAAARAFGLAGQGFALLGTTVGLITVAIGIGPRTALDIIYHISIYLVLLWGLFVTLRGST